MFPDAVHTNSDFSEGSGAIAAWLWKEPGKGWPRPSEPPFLLCSGEDVWAISGDSTQQESYL